MEADLELIDHLDQMTRKLETFILRQARVHDPQALHLIRTLPGVGKVLSLVILYEIHDIDRFPTVQDFASYARLVKCAKQSAGKQVGCSGEDGLCVVPVHEEVGCDITAARMEVQLSEITPGGRSSATP